MKIVEITPFGKSSIYGGLIKREAEIRKKGRGTFSRKGAARAGAATWSHKRFKGSVIIIKRDRHGRACPGLSRPSTPCSQRRGCPAQRPGMTECF